MFDFPIGRMGGLPTDAYAQETGEAQPDRCDQTNSGTIQGGRWIWCALGMFQFSSTCGT